MADLPLPNMMSEQDAAERKSAQNSALEKLSLVIAEMRAEAIQARQSSGIEKIWDEDTDFYERLDGESSPSEMGDKPMMRLAIGAEERRLSGGSTIFPNITRPFVDAASARVGDMLLPTDDRGWMLDPTPIPNLVDEKTGKLPTELQEQIAAMHPEDPEGAVATQEERAAQIRRIAKEKALKAQRRIDDWHRECQFGGEARAVIEDSAKSGTGVLKGPVGGLKKRVALSQDGILVMEQSVQPESRRVNYRNCYPAAGCGENIQDGDYHFERDDISPRKLRDLRGDPQYLSDQINACLEEGPQKVDAHAPSRVSGEQPRDGDKKRSFEIWYFYGDVKMKDLLTAGINIYESEERMEAEALGMEYEAPDLAELGAQANEYDAVPVHAVMVNNRLIKASPNLLDTGGFPYDYMVWQKREDSPWGIGVARQIRTPQRIVYGAARMLMDNAGKSSGPQVIIDTDLLEPAPGNAMGIIPWNVWVIKKAVDPARAQNALQFVAPPMMQSDLVAIIQLGMQMGEDITGLPMLLQGQQGSAPETVGGMQMLSNNASTVLRRLARLFDDRLTEPHVRRYYDYILQHGEDDEKGDLQVNARGSSVLVERELQSNVLPNVLELSMNPVFKKDPKKVIDEWLKSQRINPENLEFDDEDWAQMVEQIQANAEQQGTDAATARIEAEQIRQEAQKAIAGLQEEGRNARHEREMWLKGELAEIEAALEQAKTATNREAAFNTVKGRLAETAAKLRTQEKLSGLARDERQIQAITPPTEPVGRAPDGQAFQA